MSLSEFSLIDQWKQKFPNTLANDIGDDCAVVFRDGVYELFSTDCMVDHVHFLLQEQDAYWIGWKLLATNVSDIAAMGGDPKAALFSIAIPEGMLAGKLDLLTNGISDCAKEYNVNIIGGDTSRSPRDLFLNICIWGQMLTPPILRSGAQEGDVILVTGALGGSILGRHLRVQPRVKEMQWLSKQGIHAAIDISDGLWGDIQHIADSSGLNYNLYVEKIPIHADAYALSQTTQKSALIHALTDGEDYEIAFTCTESKVDSLLKDWGFASPLYMIGKMRKGGYNQLLDANNCPVLVKGGSFEHKF